MTFWLDHPSYRPIRDRLINYLSSTKYRFRRLAPVVFLCGGLQSPARATLRDYLEKHYRRSLFQRFLRRIAIEQVFPYPARLKWALLPAKIIQILGIEQFLPKFAREALSLIPKFKKADALPETSPVQGPARARVGFLSGCVMSVMFSETNSASIRLLNQEGYEVVTPADQG